MAHRSPKESEIPAPRMPEPIEKLLPHIMGMSRDVLVRLRVLDLELFMMVTPALFQSLGEGTE